MWDQKKNNSGFGQFGQSSNGSQELAKLRRENEELKRHENNLDRTLKMLQNKYNNLNKNNCVCKK